MRICQTLAIANVFLLQCCNGALLRRVIDSKVEAGGQITSRVSECALPCMATLVPEFCGSLTNVSCICTSADLAAALTPCASAACNVTEALSLARYQADTCGAVNDKSRQQQQLHLYYILPALATIFVGARLFSRIRLDAGVGADDWMMVAALLAYLTDVGTGLGIAIHGFGQHTYYLTTWQVSEALKFFYLSELFYILAITLTKLSLLLFFRRIFPNARFRLVTVIVGVFVLTSNFSLFMALCLQCLPVHGNWTNWMYKVPPVKCIDVYVAVFFAAGLSILHDLIILILPIPILWSLNLPWMKKINLLVMFSVGTFVIICSLLRLPTLLKLQTSSDPSYDQAPIAVWTNLEIGVGVICGCLPACRALFGYLFPAFKMTLNSSDKGGGYKDNAYPSTNSKLNTRSRQNHSDRSFIELTHTGTSIDHESESVNSLELKEPYNTTVKDLVPPTGKNTGLRTQVNARDNAGTSLSSLQGGDNSGIVVKTTVSQTRRGQTPEVMY